MKSASASVWPGRILCLFLICLVAAGCAGPETLGQKSAAEYMTRGTTKFFVHGPMQPGRPVELPPQEFVKLVGKDSGYSIGLLADGRRGWVDSASLRPAPATGRAASADEVFPERAAARNEALFPPLPEPDLRQPLEDVPSVSLPSQSQEKNL